MQILLILRLDKFRANFSEKYYRSHTHCDFLRKLPRKIFLHEKFLVAACIPEQFKTSSSSQSLEKGRILEPKLY